MVASLFLYLFVFLFSCMFFFFLFLMLPFGCCCSLLPLSTREGTAGGKTKRDRKEEEKQREKKDQLCSLNPRLFVCFFFMDRGKASWQCCLVFC